MVRRSFLRATSSSVMLLVLAILLIQPRPSGATPPAAVAPPPDMTTTNGQAGPPPNFFTGIERRDQLLGDIGGLRTALSKYGITLSILETSELLGNLSGGKQKGADYDGLTQVVMQMDTQRAFKHYGGTVHISGLQLHGTNLSADNLLTLQTSSGIEGDRSTRLWEIWYDQKYLDQDALDIKVGQQSLDQEFMVSQNALIFVNTMFGWPMVPSADLPGGGPAYPLSALGIRAAYRPNTTTNLLLGVYTGSPSPNSYDDPQKADSNGISFSVNNGALAIAEAQFIYPGLGSMVYFGSGQPLPRVIKVGAWYDSQRFADQRFDSDGISLASPMSDGQSLNHRGDYSLYGTVDQMVWHSTDDYERSINAFCRVMAAPQEDRNLIDFSSNIGLVETDPFAGRDDDYMGIGLGFAKVGDGASALDQDISAYTQTSYPTRTAEAFVEATYQYEVFPWLQLQPDLQYIVNPGAGVLDPSDPSHKVANEIVAGIRANIQL